MRLASILLFIAIVIFGIVRLRVSSESTAAKAQTTIQTLNSVQDQIDSLDVAPTSTDRKKFSKVIASKKQEAQQTQQVAQQNVSVIKLVQIVLTVLTALLAGIIVRLILLGRQVDTTVKTFSFGSMTTILAYWFYVPK